MVRAFVLGTSEQSKLHAGQMEKPLTYNAYRYYVQNEPGLAALVQAR